MPDVEHGFHTVRSGQNRQSSGMQGKTEGGGQREEVKEQAS